MQQASKYGLVLAQGPTLSEMFMLRIKPCQREINTEEILEKQNFREHSNTKTFSTKP